jgi:hypothetical protein
VFSLNLHRGVMRIELARILDISMGMHPKGISCGAPVVFANPTASRHISSLKIVQLRFLFDEKKGNTHEVLPFK